MKTRMICALLGILSLAACGVKVSSSNPSPAPATYEPQTVFDLKVGTAEAPGVNPISWTDDFADGASVTFVGKAAHDGSINLAYGTTITMGCNIADLKGQVTFSSIQIPNMPLTMPAVIVVKSGEEFSVKFEIGSNTCMQVQRDVLASWVKVEPANTNVPFEVWKPLAGSYKLVSMDGLPVRHWPTSVYISQKDFVDFQSGNPVESLVLPLYYSANENSSASRMLGPMNSIGHTTIEKSGEITTLKYSFSGPLQFMIYQGIVADTALDLKIVATDVSLEVEYTLELTSSAYHVPKATHRFRLER